MLYTRYSGSVFDALLVIADVATARSVDQALKEKHYRRGLRSLRAWSECLLFQLSNYESVHFPYDFKKSWISYTTLEAL